MSLPNYISTRGNGGEVTASLAILNGIAEDGGLYVPAFIPKLEKSLSELSALNYNETAYEVMKLFLSDFTEDELKECIKKAYDEKFDIKDTVALKEADGLIYLELYHGATLAFKDMALSILPHLMVTAAKKNNLKDKIMILTATSGDTGGAALSGFAGVQGTGITVFYPKGGVSAFQRKQMISEKGSNVRVVAIHGNFDDAQTGVKAVFADEAFKRSLKEKGFVLSSANSINIGRLVPQIVYYVYSASRLFAEGKIKDGEGFDVCVPTGNFGNILAAYYGKMMGLPINNLICASNTNNVLYDFFKTGIYNKNREFNLTVSPSMDILVSSNLERLLYKLNGNSPKKTAEYMKKLSETGEYTVTEEIRNEMKSFYAGYATEAETLAKIKSVYEKTEYLIDPHTAVAAVVADKYKEETGSEKVVLTASTASPFKFARTVLHAVNSEKYPLKESGTETEEWKLIDELRQISGLSLPASVKGVEEAEALHTGECEKEEMENEVQKAILT